MMSTGSRNDILQYEELLVSKIEPLFSHRIITNNFLPLIHKHNKNILHRDDIDRIRKQMENKADIDVNVTLLRCMKCYNGWFECLLQVLGDPFLKQTYLVEEFKALKDELDAELGLNQAQPQPRLMRPVPEAVPVVSEFNLEGDSPARPDPLETSGLEDSLQNLSLENNDDDCVSTGGGRHFCKICSMDLSSDKVKEEHVSGAKHKKKKKGLLGNSSFTAEAPVAASNSEASAIPEENDDDEYTLRKDGTGKCHACNVAFTSRPTAVEHLIGKTHKKKKDQRVQAAPVPNLRLGPRGEPFVRNPNGTGECFICGVTFTSQKTSDDHLEGRLHKNKEKLLNRQ